MILEEYGLAMLNRNIKLIFWIVPVISVIISPTKGKSYESIYIHFLQFFFHIESILYKVPFLYTVVNLAVYGRGPNRLK